MSSTKKPDFVNIESYLRAQTNEGFLRFITCGGVGDGKSTLIGRLLYDSKLAFENRSSALKNDGERTGTQGERVNYASLVDRLPAELEQGISADVPYRIFTTDKRKFIVADTAGRQQYTRSMAICASTADLAVVLVDARQGLMTQTHRHSFIASLFGIRHFVLAVNKMDLVGYNEALFNEICSDFLTFAEKLNLDDINCIPVSASQGDNIVSNSERTDWYSGPPLKTLLENIDVGDAQRGRSFRLMVPGENRPGLDSPGFSGIISGGSIATGDPVVVVPSGRTSTIEKIFTAHGDLRSASTGQAVSMLLSDEFEISPGDVICAETDPIQISKQLQTHIVWMHDRVMVPGRQYTLKAGAFTTSFVVTELKHKINVNTLETQAAKTLAINEIGVANLGLEEAIAFDPHTANRYTGKFIIIDRQSDHAVGAGLFDFSLRRADNVVWQSLSVDKFHRSAIKHQRSCVLWMTGLPASGKSTIANMLEARLHDMHRHTYILDGDNVRHGLSRDLGFVEADRVENIRRVGETAKLMVDAGLITIVSFISPFARDRKMVRELLEPGEFTEVFISTPLTVCESRDPKGLYKKARAGEIENFTGIGAEYEAPTDPELLIPTHELSPEQAVDKLVAYLQERGFLSAPSL